jgi:hypothetical protein
MKTLMEEEDKYLETFKFEDEIEALRKLLQD